MTHGIPWARWIAVMLVCTFASCLTGLAQDGDNITVGPPPAVPAQEQPEALTSGPVHEAFAEPVNVDTQQTVVAPSQPPANIQETPPAQRPAGDNYSWVPGYWGWDNDRHNYIWVSGCWRIAPPNTYWVPGYWAQTSIGWQWVAGFWAPIAQQELQYQPAPPTIPAEQLVATGAPPTPDDVWVPPCYYWANGGYVIRPGYWLPAQQGWLWVPSCNRWTPRGYVFCAGHWDYSFEHRGLLFAPVAFQPGVSVGASIAFTPNIVLNLGLVSSNLFVCPRYCHYYFGDYYDPGYVQFGIFAPFDYGHLHNCYDPIYVHDRWLHREDPRWEDARRNDYDQRRDNKDLRPARTYQEMETRVARAPEAQRQNMRLAEPLATVAASRTAPMKFEQSNREAQQKLATHAADVRKYSEQRTQWETKPGAREVAPPAAEPRATGVGAPVPARTPEPARARPEAVNPAEPARPVPAEQRANQPVAPAAPERREPVATPTPPPARQAPVVVPPESAATPPEGRAPAPAAPAERRAPAAASAEPKAPALPVHAEGSQAERVKVPPSPITSAHGAENPPAHPNAERQDRGDAKDPNKQPNR